jgi:hypothetical protein
VLVGTAQGASTSTVRLYGLVYPARVNGSNPQPVSLARLDPSTLAPVSRRSLGGFIGFVVPSADERRVAVVVPHDGVLRLYEGLALRRVVRVGPRGDQVRSVVWTRPNRLVAIDQHMSEPYARYVRARYVVGVDAANGRVLFRTRLDRRLALVGAGSSHGRVALLYQSSSLLARRARITVVSTDGAVRSAPLHFGRGRSVRLLAALAVDPRSPHAYVVLSGGRVAAVDLRTLRLAYHTIAALPAAKASAADYVTLRAETFGPHSLVVSGLFALRPQASEVPAGLAVVDTHTWQSRVIDRRATTFAVAGDTIVTAGRGITGYRADGARHYHLLGARRISLLQVVQGRGHAWVGDMRPFQLGTPTPTRVIIFSPRSGLVFGRASLSQQTRVALLDPSAGY